MENMKIEKEFIEKIEAINCIDGDRLLYEYKLLQLAPQMRLEVLRMAKEIERLNNEVLKLKRFNSTKKILGSKPKTESVSEIIYEAVGSGYGFNGSKEDCIKKIEEIINKTP